MFTDKILSDCEGAVLCQLLFQSLAGTQSLNPLMEQLLDLTVQRMQKDPRPVELKKQLIGVLMAAMYYNAGATVQYLQNKEITIKLVEEMFTLRKNFTLEYERRFFIAGLSRMLMVPNLPLGQPHVV